MKRLLLTGAAVLLLGVGRAWAGPFEDGNAAYQRGDYVEAVKRFGLGATQGNADSQATLGLLYAVGDGVARNFTEAVRWLRLAAAQGNARAQDGLGTMYLYGRGVPQDYVRAHMWFNLSGTTGDVSGLKDRDTVAAKMTPQQISEAQKMARECQQRNFKGCD